MIDAEAEYNKIGAPVVRGKCAVCGGTIIRTGKTEAHEGLAQPEKAKKTVSRTGKLVIVESTGQSKNHRPVSG